MLIHASHGTDMSSRDQEFFKTMGARITAARKTHDLTQQELAEHLGIAQQTYAQYEAGIRRIPASMLPPLAQRLGVTMDELLGIKSPSRTKPGPANKFELQIERVRKLPRTKQQLILSMLDAFLATAS